MLVPLNQMQVDALAALRLQSSWKTYCSMLADELTATQDRMVREFDEPTLRRLQGRAQMLADLMEVMRNVSPQQEQRPVHKWPEGTW
jgi:hypothetical protein